MSTVNWPKVLLKKLLDNPDMVKIYVIPGLLFFLDFVLRAVLGVDLIDAGADMALLAVATFVSLLVEDIRPQQYYTAIMVVFIMLFLALWIICLRIVSAQNPISFLMVDFRLVLSWFVGLTSFVFSGIMVNEVVQGTSNFSG